MAAEALDDYRNLILLCPTHHKLIDDQPNEYSVGSLAEIKRDHERWVGDTLEWRAGIPDAIWGQIEEHAETLQLEQSESVGAGSSLLDDFGVFVVMTAELLAAEELAFFIRSKPGGLSFAFKYERGRILYAYGERLDFAAAFSAFDDAPAIEDKSEAVRLEAEGLVGEERRDNMAMFNLAASTLSHIARKTSCEQTVFYIRNRSSIDLPEFGFRVKGDDVAIAAGPTSTFSPAFEEFGRSDHHDVTEKVKIEFFSGRYSDRARGKKSKAISMFLANLFSAFIVHGLDGRHIDPIDVELEKWEFARLLRNRFYDALLMLREADHRLQDPRFREWVEDRVDPGPPDGLSAVLPDACVLAIGDFIEHSEFSGDDEGELEEDALGRLYKAISLVHRSHGEEGDDAAAQLILDRLQWWQTPEASEEILELLGTSESRD